MKTYTTEQLTTMTPEELKAAILEMQAQGELVAGLALDIAQQPDLPAIVNYTAEQLTDMTKEDLQKIKADFKATAEATILEIEQKITEKEAEAKAKVEQIGAELVAAEQTFVEKYGQAIAHGIEIVLLGAILGKILGLI